MISRMAAASGAGAIDAPREAADPRRARGSSLPQCARAASVALGRALER